MIGSFEDAGAGLCTIAPQLPAHARAMSQNNGVTFPMLYDAGNDVAAQYGLRMTLPADLHDLYQSFGINLPTYNGDDSLTLPIPARLIIDPSGTVRHIDAGIDYTIRPEPSDTLERLHALMSS